MNEANHEYLLTGNAGEEAEEVQGRGEEDCVVAFGHAEHFLRRVGGDHGVLVFRADALVIPRSDVEPSHGAILGFCQGQHLGPWSVGSVRHQKLRQVDVLSKLKKVQVQAREIISNFLTDCGWQKRKLE